MNENKKNVLVLSLGFGTILSILFILFNIREDAELLVDYSSTKDILFYILILCVISFMFKLIEQFYKVCQTKKNSIKYVFQIFVISLLAFFVISFIFINLYYIFAFHSYTFSVLLKSYRVHLCSMFISIIIYLFILCIIGYLGYRK